MTEPEDAHLSRVVPDPYTDARPYEDPHKPGRKDVDGVEWWACDPYPTWYRWENGELITKEYPKWAE